MYTLRNKTDCRGAETDLSLLQVLHEHEASDWRFLH